MPQEIEHDSFQTGTRSVCFIQVFVAWLEEVSDISVDCSMHIMMHCKGVSFVIQTKLSVASTACSQVFSDNA